MARCQRCHHRSATQRHSGCYHCYCFSAGGQNTLQFLQSRDGMSLEECLKSTVWKILNQQLQSFDMQQYPRWLQAQCLQQHGRNMDLVRLSRLAAISFRSRSARPSWCRWLCICQPGNRVLKFQILEDLRKTSVLPHG